MDAETESAGGLAAAGGDGQPQRCLYCGAELNPRLYFCPRCATPYKSPEGVLPPVGPLELTDGERVARKAPQVKVLFWSYFAVAVGCGVLVWLAGGEAGLDLALIVGSLAVMATTCVFAVAYWPSLAVQFRRPGFDQLAGWLAVGAVAPLLVVNYGYHGLVQWLAGGEQVSLVTYLRDRGMGEGALVLFLCVLPALAEETGFRGLLQHWLAAALSPRKALVIAAALFTLLHFSVVSAPYVFLLGMLLGWSKARTGSLYPAMVAHFAHNLFVVAYPPF